MCGIVYYKDLKGRAVNNAVIERYRQQRGRGTNGFGFYIPELDRMVHNPRENRIIRLLQREKDVSEVLFHHRFPTSTSNVRSACHPFSTKANAAMFEHQYVLVHNGVLANEDVLKREHEKLGIKYVSEQPDGRFNDSEALLYDVALTLEGKQDRLKAQGTIAFVVIEKDGDEAIKVHFARNYGNPLKIQRKRGKFIKLASEGHGSDIEPHVLYTFDYKTEELTKQWFSVPGYTYTAQSSNHIYDGRSASGSSRIDDALAAIEASYDQDDKYTFYDLDLTRPIDPAPSLANVFYRNGFYDEKGRWSTYAEGMKPGVKYNDPPVPTNVKSQLDDQIDEFVEYLLSECDDDIAAAKTLGKHVLHKQREEYIKLDRHTENPLFDMEKAEAHFSQMDMFAAEIDVIKGAITRLESMTEGDLVQQRLGAPTTIRDIVPVTK